MLFVTHPNADKRIKRAASRAHEVLTNPQQSQLFFEAVCQVKIFDDSKFTGPQLAEKIGRHIAELQKEKRSINLAVYRSPWYYRHTNAYVNVGIPSPIWCNSRNFNRPIASMVGTIIHEFVHSCDYLDKGDNTTDHGHRSNKAKYNYYTAPSVLGRIASRIVNNIDHDSTIVEVAEAPFLNQVEALEPILDKLDYIAIGHQGSFSTYGAYKYTAAELDSLTDHLKEKNIKKLAIYCHGGLVNESNGADAVRRVNESLSEGKPDDFHSIGFIWKTGIGETFRENVKEALSSGLSSLLLNRLVGYFRKQFFTSLYKENFELESFELIEQMLIGKIKLEDPSLKPEIMTIEDSESGEFFFGIDNKISDETLKFEAGSIIAEIDSLQNSEFNSMWLDGGNAGLQREEELKSILSDYDEFGELVNEISKNSLVSASSTNEAKGLGRIYTVYKILKAIYQRWKNKTWHGIHATVAEEILRTIYVDDITKAFWDEMKEKAKEIWEENKAGYELISQLNKKCPGIKIHFIGHSAGANCGAYLIKLLNSGIFEKVTLESCSLMAPATNYSVFNETYVKYKESYGDFTMYAMTDEAEKEDDLLDIPYLRHLYPSSLLYLISGIMEDKVDMPIVGMHRFKAGNHSYSEDNFIGFDAVQKHIYEDGRVNLTPVGDYTVDDHAEFDNDVYKILPEIRLKITGV